MAKQKKIKEQPTIDLNQREGFRIGNYFISFPPNEAFIKEDENGNLFAAVDIFTIDGDNVTKFAGTVPKELEDAISDEFNRILDAAMQLEKEAAAGKGTDNVED